jgi:hypothetical protein
LHAQTTTSGGLTGVVTDTGYSVALGADVEIRDTAKGITQSTKTNHEGVYRFFFLATFRLLGETSTFYPSQPDQPRSQRHARVIVPKFLLDSGNSGRRVINIPRKLLLFHSTANKPE